MSIDQAITRRSALTASAIVVAGGVLGFAIARNSSAATTPKGTTAANAYANPPSGSGQRLVAVSDVPDGGGVVLTNPAVVITRQGQQVQAFSAVCTHQGCHVDNVATGSIRCPCHGSRFDAGTGAVTNGPASTPLPRVAVTVRNGEVFSG
ncbi:MAG TPA: Rieske (2Fe-2S) protein [Jatrophihabitantaceae bacterium]|nr:Rieske (2Fe-2S) protein [Jatrophihabitantaceae bacterium]